MVTNTDTSAEAVDHECRNIHDCTILLMIPAMYGQRWQDMLSALLAERDQLQAQLEKADRLVEALDRDWSDASWSEWEELKSALAAYRKDRINTDDVEYTRHDHALALVAAAVAHPQDAQAALEAYRKRVREEALRKAAGLCRTKADKVADENNYMELAYLRAMEDILALVRQDDSMIEGDTDE